MACQVRVSGRRGVLLIDSGYHVPRTVCVMADRLPPHTGELPMDCLSGQLTHGYELSPNYKFAICSINRTTAAGTTSTDRTCIFIGGHFENPYAFAEYRKHLPHAALAGAPLAGGPAAERPELLTEPQLEALQAAGRQLRLSPDQWQQLLQRSVDALSDRKFIDRVLQVNERILYELGTDDPPSGWQRPDV
ncbi:hypothetical protein FJT64_005872 [Amphibalanus amphitrite]|uniref:Uncharacterized protein n=1 Tax=Amphibalanus amphitrite TaxID=1232801 RepID=A0A6A4VYP7_AMPAM|nr:hypothetical protein FJT64_005872 [Amphibalanus amphitrite]